MDVMVVKVGGVVRPDAVLDDIAALSAGGAKVILVHGGGPAIDELASALDVPRRTIQSPDGSRSRRTDAEALDVMSMALLGRVKPALVSGLRARGVLAAGLCGADGALLTAKRKPALRSVEGDRIRLIRDDRSGTVTTVLPEILYALLAAGITPVVSPPAATVRGELLNVDSDQVAAQIAVAMRAAALILLSDVPGVLSDPADPSSLIPALTEEPPGVTGRMRHKIRAAMRAREHVRRVVIGTGDAERPVEMALRGAGTLIMAPERVAV